MICNGDAMRSGFPVTPATSLASRSAKDTFTSRAFSHCCKPLCIIKFDTVKPVSPALGFAPRPVAPSSRISPPAPVEAPGNGEIAVG